MKINIIIPARYSSKRLPGKPLIKIAGQTMLSRVVEIARIAAQDHEGVSILVATDDERISNHCEELGVEWVMTPAECPSGTDRVHEVVSRCHPQPDFVINLQGDTPLTPPHYLSALIHAFIENPQVQVVTPITQLSWEALDQLRESKKHTPFSGTCVIVDDKQQAIWFSKHIIPSIRNEEKYRASHELSPVFKHVGMYGYSPAALKAYTSWESSQYEILEGLEQLRFLENGYTISTVKLENASLPIIGVDSPKDVEYVEQLLQEVSV